MSKSEISQWVKDATRNNKPNANADNGIDQSNKTNEPLTQAQKIALREKPKKPLPSGEGLDIQFTV